VTYWNEAGVWDELHLVLLKKLRRQFHAFFATTDRTASDALNLSRRSPPLPHHRHG